MNTLFKVNSLKESKGAKSRFSLFRNEFLSAYITNQIILHVQRPLEGCLLDGGFFHLQVCYHPLKRYQPEHRSSGRLGGQYIHNSLNAIRQIKLKTFTDSPPGSFWRKEACRSEPSWPIFSLITYTALKTEEHQGQLHQSCRFLPEMSAISAQI